MLAPVGLNFVLRGSCAVAALNLNWRGWTTHLVNMRYNAKRGGMDYERHEVVTTCLLP